MKKDVLLIRLSSFGDLILLTSCFEYLQEKANTYLLTSETYRGLFDDDPRIKGVFYANSGKIDIKKKFDIVCDMHFKLKSQLISLKIKAKKRCAYKKRIWARRLAVLLHRKIREIPVYKLYLSPLQDIFKDDYSPIPRIVTDAKALEGLPSRYVLMFPGASVPTKIWPYSYFVELARLIWENYRIKSIFAGYSKASNESFITEKPGNMPYDRLIAYTKRAVFVVSNDSGPAHLAAALSVPLFVFFGPTVPEFGFRPVSRAPVYLFERKLPCRPCSLHGDKPCRRGDVKCLRDITPVEVFKKVNDLMMSL